MSEETFKQQSLSYHRDPRPGKLAIMPTKPMANQSDLSKAYSPGVAHACEAIVERPDEAVNLTARGNLIGVVSNGTAVLGLGNIGGLASKPVMEGKAVLFKKFADVDVFDIEIAEQDPHKLVDVIAALEPTFGGINLEDIKAPECFVVERELRERMKIPVFHDDQHGTAIVAAAAVYNGLRVVDKRIEDVRLVVSGAGAASLACTDLIVSMGLKPENVCICDSRGVIYKGRTAGMNEYKEKYAVETDKRSLSEAMEDADIFFGLSGPGVLTADDVKRMAPNPLILALANPVPEILPEVAMEARPDAIVATGRSDYPNQVNNLLCFPYIFRGALDCGATTINEEMKIACVKAIADLATRESVADVAAAYGGERLKFGRKYLIPTPFDPRLIAEVPVAVVKAAMDSGVASRPIDDLDVYRAKLSGYVVRSRVFMAPMVEAAKRRIKRVIYAEGENYDVLLAVQSVVDEGLAEPVLLGRPSAVQEHIDALGLRLKVDRDIEIIDPEQACLRSDMLEHYYRIVGRKGVPLDAAKKQLRSSTTSLAATLVNLHEADAVICGKVGRFSHHLRIVLDVVGPATRDDYASSVSTILTQEGPIFLSDCFVNVKPNTEEIVRITQASIEKVQHFGITPRVALLSHSNFGSSRAPSAIKMRQAAEILRDSIPDIEIDGEMQSMSALNRDYRQAGYAYTNLSGDANLLICPDLDSANIALGLLRTRTNGLLIGPFLTGLARPVHILIPSVTARGIYNMTAMAAGDIVRSDEEAPA